MASPAADRPLRLLIVVNVFHPDRGGGAAVFSDMARGLAERGLDVTVRCAYPYYPEWRDKSGRNGVRVERYIEQGVAIERYGLYIPGDPNSLGQRLVYEASFFASLVRGLPRSRRFDVAMVFCPLVGAVGYAALQKRLFGTPLWLNVQDLAAEAAEASGITKGKRTGRLLSRVQTALFNAADVWSSISPEMIRRLAPHRRRGQPLLYVPNWLNQSVVDTVETLESKVGRPAGSSPNLLYAGNIGSKQDLLRFCQILAGSDATFSFRIHGSGGRAEELRAWLTSVNDPRFEFGPFLDEASFVRAIHDADLFVITETAGSGGSFIPSKLIPAIATGTPILAVSDATSPLGQEVLQHDLGPHFEWGLLDDMPALLEALGGETSRIEQWQHKAIERSAFYDRDRLLDLFEDGLRRLARGEPLTDLQASGNLD